MARPIEGPLTCESHNLQASTDLLGKLRLAVRHEESSWTFPREVLEALEACEEVPLPARHGFWAVPGSVAVEVVIRGSRSCARGAIGARLEERGVPVRELHLVEYLGEHLGALRRPVPLGCDLKEALS